MRVRAELGRWNAKYITPDKLHVRWNASDEEELARGGVGSYNKNYALRRSTKTKRKKENIFETLTIDMNIILIKITMKKSKTINC